MHADLVPDLSGYDTSSLAAREWLLSDHPWAVTERARRAAAARGHDFALLVRTELFAEHVARIHPDEVDEVTEQRLHNALAELRMPMEVTLLVRDAHGQGQADGQAAVEAERARLQDQRRDAGDIGYRFPARLMGPSAESIPPPGFTYVQPKRGRIADPLENLADSERARIAFITAAIPVLVDGAQVLEIGGYAPVQVAGTYHGKSWFHRHRHGLAELGIGGDPVSDPDESAELTIDDPAMFSAGAQTTVRAIGALFAKLHPPTYLP